MTSVCLAHLVPGTFQTPSLLLSKAVPLYRAETGQAAGSTGTEAGSQEKQTRETLSGSPPGPLAGFLAGRDLPFRLAGHPKYMISEMLSTTDL